VIQITHISKSIGSVAAGWTTKEAHPAMRTLVIVLVLGSLQREDMLRG
jgi:hypothetical protein